jgi:hypothetical protein
MTDDLASAPTVDLASVDLDYEAFRRLSQNPHLSANERIGFPDAYRVGFDDHILADIGSKLPRLMASHQATVLDVGPGCASLAHRLIDRCAEQRHQLHLMDSPEMLSQLPDGEAVTKHAGMFPRDFDMIAPLVDKVDLLICYSVFHYVFVEANPFTFMDRCLALLAPGGRALIGDIPNLSKRRRFFASAAGREYHRTFTNTETTPAIPLFEAATSKIDDAVLAGLVGRAHAAGCDAYVVPQSPELPMANRRDDLVLIKP